ncbi:MAG: PAS domain-containing protein [Paracoccaceae bacterium]
MDQDDILPEDYVKLDAYRLNRSHDMIHSELRALYNYWNTLRAGRTTPLRSDIDPRDMQCDARNLFILENLGRGNIRFRLAGTAIVEAFGMELRGMNARAIMSTASRESFTALITEALEDPGAGYARLRDASDEESLWEVNLLPLRSDFGMIDRVIGCLHPLTRPGPRRNASPLRFRIEHMSVEPVNATTRELSLPSPIETYAETRLPERHLSEAVDDMLPPVRGFELKAIEGGLEGITDQADRPAPTRGHLRLIKD